MDDDLKLADWSEIHGDLLFFITDKLKSTFSLSEYIRFGAVCFEWRSFFSIQNYKEQIKLPSNLPLLLIPNPSHEDDNNNKQVILQDDDDDFEDDNHGDEEEEEQLEDGFEDDDDNHEEEQFDDDNHEEEQFDDDNHEEDDEDDEEEEQLEDRFYGFYGVIVPKPREYYYKPKDIWKGQDAETRYKSTRSFYSLSHRKVYQNFRLPVPYYKNCRGSSHGWLITVDEEEQPDGTYIYPVRLLNPFRSVNNQIQLPPLTPIPELEEEPKSSYYLRKAYLSANPSSLSNPSKDLLVFGVYGSNRFGFCRPGDSAWTHFPVENHFRPIQDLICYKSRFLAIIQNGSVLELDFAHHLLHPKPPSVKFVALPPANGNIFDKKYLVESGGDLLQVERHHVDYARTTGFRAFKLNDDDKWVKMGDLDGRMLFLGDNSSISLSAADFPGLMPNCIYFTDDNYGGYEVGDWEGPHDIGIFNFEDKSVVLDPDPLMPPPIWIQPML